MTELATPIALGCSVVAIPVVLDRVVPADRFARQRLLEALLLVAPLAAVAYGLAGEAGGRAIALGTIIFSALRVVNPAPASPTRPLGDPLITVAAFAVGALVQPIGPGSPFHGLGMLMPCLFLYWSADSPLLTKFMALGALLRTAGLLFT